MLGQSEGRLSGAGDQQGLEIPPKCDGWIEGTAFSLQMPLKQAFENHPHLVTVCFFLIITSSRSLLMQLFVPYAEIPIIIFFN